MASGRRADGPPGAGQIAQERAGGLRMPEKVLQGQVMELARLTGFLSFHDAATSARLRCRNCGARQSVPRNAPGFPDAILLHPRRRLLVAAELKSESGRLTEVQYRWLAGFAAVEHVVAGVWVPSSWDDIKALLIGDGRCIKHADAAPRGGRRRGAPDGEGGEHAGD